MNLGAVSYNENNQLESEQYLLDLNTLELIRIIQELKDENEELKKQINRYKEALNRIATRKMSTYLSSSHMNQDFIKTAIDALGGD